MEDTWSGRDLPVLNAIVERFDRGEGPVSPFEIQHDTQLSAEDVDKALRALDSEEPPYFTATTAGVTRDVIKIMSVTGYARRAVGAWPSPDALADRILAGLRDAAENADDKEERSRLRRLAAWLGGAGRDILVDVAGTALAKTAGLS